MIIFLYGPDTFMSRQKLNEIIEQYKKTHKSGLGLKFWEGNEIDFSEIKNAFQQASMFFQEKKLLVLKDALKNKNFAKDFMDDFTCFEKSDNIILIYQREKIEAGDDFFRFLKRKTKSQEFGLLSGAKLKDWLKKEFEKLGAEVDLKVIEALATLVGPDLWALSNEIQKIVNYKPKGKLTSREFNLLIKPRQIETNIFKTIDAIAAKDKKTALQLINRHLEKGDNPFYIFTMIGYQTRNLLSVKELEEQNKTYNEILKTTKLNSFVARKTYLQAKKFSFETLKKIYKKIFEIDLNVKTGKARIEQAIDLLVAEI